MNSDNDALVFILLIVSVCGVIGGYKVGRYLERRDLTKYFIEMTQLTYSDAYKDCIDGLNR